jgi:hypothetical protein
MKVMEANNLNKKFGGFTAVNNISFSIGIGVDVLVLFLITFLFSFSGSYFFSKIQV